MLLIPFCKVCPNVKDVFKVDVHEFVTALTSIEDVDKNQPECEALVGISPNPVNK